VAPNRVNVPSVAFRELLSPAPALVTDRLLTVVLAGMVTLKVDPVDVEKVPFVPPDTVPACIVNTVLSAVEEFPAQVLDAELVNSSAVSFNQKEAVDVPDPGE
jgi:hypothetical protein